MHEMASKRRAALYDLVVIAWYVFAELFELLLDASVLLSATN